MTPRLVVRDGAAAIAFYLEALGAREIERYVDPGGRLVHAALGVGNGVIALTEEAKDEHTHAPPSLGGSPVILILEVDDPDAVAARMVAAGGAVIFPIADQFYGHREGRVSDPFGHVWILTKVIEELSPEEIQRRLEGG